MIRLKIAICDDDKSFVQCIHKSITRYQFIRNIDFDIYEYYDSSSLLKAYNSPGAFDIILLDVEMPIHNGIETATIIRNLPDETVNFIFISNYPEYMSESFDVHAYHYLSKPYNESKLYTVLDHLSNSIIKGSFGVLPLADNSSGRISLIPIHEICYINYISKKKCLNIHTTSNVIDYHSTLSHMYTILHEYGFEYAHRNTIVNLHYVKLLKTNALILTNGETISSSVRCDKQLKKIFSEIILSKTE